MSEPTAAALARARSRSGEHRGPTTGMAPGYAQANLVVLPSSVADDFEAYCERNPAPCPLLERLAAGDPTPRQTAPTADIRSDLPRYRRYGSAGAFTEATDLAAWWTADAVGFLLGCSFTVEHVLAAAGLVPRHWETGGNVPMYRTDRPTIAAGPFRGPLVVTMRPFPAERVAEVIGLSAPYRLAHGAPVWHGDPAGLGIERLDRPEWGDPVPIRPGEVPVFWACGVTSQVAVVNAIAVGAIAWAITHAPGHMFITDLAIDSACGVR